jgi:RHS repeat-associated protein
LIKITYKNNPTFVRTEMSYDGFGKVHIITDVKKSGTQDSYRLVWCGETVCQKRDAFTNALIRSYDGQGEWSGANFAYYLKDHLGSVVGVMNTSATDQRVSIQYDPYGMVLSKTVKTAADAPLSPDKGYAGMYYHEASGLNMTHYRWYNSFTRRWISRDPIGEAGGINLYGYVGGNPVMYVDPLGLTSCPPGMRQKSCNSDGSITCEDDPSSDRDEKRCVTAECAAGLLPTKSDNRTPDQAQKDGDKRICHWACQSISEWSAVALPGGFFVRKAVGIVADNTVCRLVCD